MIRHFLLYTFSFALLTGCSSGEQETKTEETSVKMEERENAEIIDELFHSIPPPIELSSLLKNSGYLYNIDYLNPVSNVSKYDMSFQKAINLGIYATDIAYIHIYNQPQDALKYLTAIKSIADELNISDLLDYSTLQVLLREETSESYDSLINMTTHNFEDINFKLREQGREHISAMIVTGGWIEGFHLLNELYRVSENKELNEKIAEQKFTLAQILILLSHFEDSKFLTDLHASLLPLQKTLDKAKKAEDESGFNGWLLSPEDCQLACDQINELRSGIIN